MKFNPSKTAAILTAILLASVLEAADRTSQTQPEDTIAVIANIALTSKTIDAIYIATYSRRNYVYLKDASRRTLTIVDVTNAGHPTVTKTVALPESSANDTLGLVVGDAALMIADRTKPTAQDAKSVSIVDLSQAGSPKVMRQFSGVTAIRTDDERGLIYLVDESGLQILRKHPAPDRELEREYAKQVLYNR